MVWLDCDPGLDDTFAIILAAQHPDIELMGLSTSAGNSSLGNTTRNALDILFNIQCSHIQVVKGSNMLIAGEPALAEYVHGAGGLGGVLIPRSDKEAITENNFQTIRDMLFKR